MPCNPAYRGIFYEHDDAGLLCDFGPDQSTFSAEQPGYNPSCWPSPDAARHKHNGAE